MTAQIIELDAVKAKNARAEQQVPKNWTDEWEPEERHILASMFMEDLIGGTDMCECDICKTRDEDVFFEDGCPSCGEKKKINTGIKNSRKDFLVKWDIGWGWVFGSDLSKPMGCVGNMPWGHFDTSRNILTYDNGSEYITVALPPDEMKILELDEYGLHVFALAKNLKAIK